MFPFGHAFFPDHQDPGEHIRLAFSWVSLDEIPEAARRLAVACERVANGAA